MPRTVNFVTGPSRSADIEQTLLLGAHGPRAAAHRRSSTFPVRRTPQHSRRGDLVTKTCLIFVRACGGFGVGPSIMAFRVAITSGLLCLALCGAGASAQETPAPREFARHDRRAGAGFGRAHSGRRQRGRAVRTKKKDRAASAAA